MYFYKVVLLAKAVGRDIKGKLSAIFYLPGIAIAFYQPYLAEAIYVLVALMWLIPNKRIERVLVEDEA